MCSRFIFLFTGIFFLSACSEDKQRLFSRTSHATKDFVLEMQHFFSDSEDNMSFPIWFEDSLIRLNKIKSLERKIFNLNGNEGDLASLKTEKQYEFDENGRIISVQISEYYEGQKVSAVTFEYSGVRDGNGFQQVKMTRMNKLNEDLTGYQLYEKEQAAANFMAYLNSENGNYLFFLPNEKHWGTLSVDSILGPTPEDFIVFGTPKRPSKRYHVANRVNESDVRLIDYVKNSENPSEIKFELEPFEYKRNIEYDRQGNCRGFIDSTFSMDRYLMRRISKFGFNENKLPSRVTHSSARSDNNDKNTQIETFEYTYYD